MNCCWNTTALSEPEDNDSFDFSQFFFDTEWDQSDISIHWLGGKRFDTSEEDYQESSFEEDYRQVVNLLEEVDQQVEYFQEADQRRKYPQEEAYSQEESIGTGAQWFPAVVNPTKKNQ